jgi:hypothetical protein
MIEALVDAEIPVMGHLGLTPQSMHAMGGFRVQAKESQAALALVADAKALEHAGCFAIVLEGVPDQVARMVTEAVDVPTIGIGAGRDCDGQVLVLHDLLGVEDRHVPKFVRRYAELGAAAVDAVSAFAASSPRRWPCTAAEAGSRTGPTAGAPGTGSHPFRATGLRCPGGSVTERADYAPPQEGGALWIRGARPRRRAASRGRRVVPGRRRAGGTPRPSLRSPSWWRPACSRWPPSW